MEYLLNLTMRAKNFIKFKKNKKLMLKILNLF